jgi:hypothetical protein
MDYCIFPQLATGSACAVCGYQLQRNYEVAPIRECGNAPREPGLGDYTEQLLAHVKVTKGNYIAAKDVRSCA